MNKTLKIILFILMDLTASAIAWVLSVVLLRYPWEVLTQNLLFCLIGLFLPVLVNGVFGLYSKLWRYAGFIDAVKIGIVGVIIGSYNMLTAYLSLELTVEWAIISTFILVLFIGSIRFLYRLVATLGWFSKIKTRKLSERVMIIGAGSAGDMLIREMKSSNKVAMNPICVIDDDKNKIGQKFNGIKVVGDTSTICVSAEKYKIDKIIIAIPSANKKVISDLVLECQKTSCKVMIIPGVFQLMNGQVSISSIKEASVEDLLGREQVKVNLSEILDYIENKVVLVTGGGGSIGSELCRQIASHNPKQLIILDIYENNAYDIEQELLSKHKDLSLLTLIASVRDENKINKVFEKYRPNIVFHAAAHKHVPLMETSPNEAVKNNVCGTYNVAKACGEFGAERMILISTDKAVNPTNIMGASKRICEMIIQTMNKKYSTEYVAVRFGNVLGSNGSVIPLFKKQIAEGGPVTVTDKNIVRYFMVIPEAVSLVLQAGAYAKGGEIFVLDMGEPVRIYDLALNVIKFSGLEPFKDIDIKIIGLRPGEKLYEERLMAEEGLQKTANDMISIGRPLDIDEENLFSSIEELRKQAYLETDKIKELVHKLVPTYTIYKGNDN